MIDGGVATEALRQRRRLAEDEAVLVVEDRADMLHAAERKGWREQQVEFGKGEGDTEPVAEPAYGGAIGRDLRIGIDLGAARGARVEADRALPRRRGSPVRPGARGEGGKIGGNRLGFGEAPARAAGHRPLGIERAVGDHRPTARRGQSPAEPRLEVGLVEAGEQQIGVGGDEQGVEIGLAVLVVMIADDRRPRRRDRCREAGGYDVGAGLQQRRGQDEVAVDPLGRGHRTAVDDQIGEHRPAKVED